MAEGVYVSEKTTGRGRLLADEHRLFLSLSERLSELFLQITRLSESIPLDDPARAQDILGTMRTLSESAMLLTQSYTVDARLRSRLIHPEVQAITASSLLHEMATTLRPLAIAYGVTLTVDEPTNSVPILGDPVILHAALTSLVQVFVLAASEQGGGETLRISAHRSRHGLVAGVYMESSELTTDAFRRAKRLYGSVSEPMGKLVHGPATGVFVADSLLHMVSAKLHVARYQHWTGLATTLPICHQLQLV